MIDTTSEFHAQNLISRLKHQTGRCPKEYKIIQLPCEMSQCMHISEKTISVLPVLCPPETDYSVSLLHCKNLSLSFVFELRSSVNKFYRLQFH